jgi:hypothetical protein
METLERNTEVQFMYLRSGDIFRTLDDGFYYMVTPERMHHGAVVNAICVDGCVGGNQCANPVKFDFTEKVLYLGSLGVNWFPDEF